LAALGIVAAVMIGLVLAGETVIALALLFMCLVGGASVNGMQAFMYAVSSHSYPTSIRGSAIGVAQTFSRVGALASPPAAAWYFASDLSVTTFLFMMAGVMCLTTVSFFLIPSHIPKNAKEDEADTGKKSQAKPDTAMPHAKVEDVVS
jgi:MFS family permease